jgi:hypothetical protein
LIPWYTFVKNAGWLDSFKHNIEGELVAAMEEKTKKCVEAGAKNKISYNKSRTCSQSSSEGV